MHTVFSERDMVIKIIFMSFLLLQHFPPCIVLTLRPPQRPLLRTLCTSASTHHPPSEKPIIDHMYFETHWTGLSRVLSPQWLPRGDSSDLNLNGFFFLSFYLRLILLAAPSSQKWYQRISRVLNWNLMDYKFFFYNRWKKTQFSRKFWEGWASTLRNFTRKNWATWLWTLLRCFDNILADHRWSEDSNI